MREIITTSQQHKTITIIVYHISFLNHQQSLIKSHEKKKIFLPIFSNVGHKDIIKLKMTMTNLLPFLKK